MMLVFYTCANGATVRTTPVPVPEQFETGKVIDPVICKADPTQSYALYIPAKGRRDPSRDDRGPSKGNEGPLPVIYFFDAHGDGSLPLNKYKSLADAYGFILVGSNNSKNGNDWPASENIWRRLVEDSKSRLRIDGGRVYTGGFSGGAKVAGYVALQHPGIKGVIANGAGLPDGVPAGDFNFSFTAIAGENDMNLTDLTTLNNNLDKSRTRHRILFFDGNHEWAPLLTMNTAFAGLQLDAMREGLIPKDEVFINRYVVNSKNRLAAYDKAGQPVRGATQPIKETNHSLRKANQPAKGTDQLLRAMQECQVSISFLDGLAPAAGWFKGKAAALAGNELYQKQRQSADLLLRREEDTKAGYGSQFQQGDTHYWVSTIHDLQTKAGAKAAGSAMYQRLLAYLSLAFYSFSNHLINSQQNNEARRFVELYKLADPSNSEAWYFSAILHAREGQAQAAQSDLLKATGYGFRDRNRLKQQPEFKNLPAPPLPQQK